MAAEDTFICRFTLDRDTATSDEKVELLGLDHPLVQEELGRWRSLPPEELGVALSAPNKGPVLLSNWLIETSTRNGEKRAFVQSIAVDANGTRVPAIEKQFSKILKLPTANKHMEAEERLSLFNLTVEPTVPIRLSPTPTICRVWRRVAREADEAGMDVPQREDLSFPRSFPEFQRLFPDDAACAAYLEKARWGDGFVCPHCQTAAEPFRFTSRPGVLRCRKCRRDTGLTAGTVMERSHTSLGVWFWAAYLVASQTPGMSATQFQRQVGLSRYETAFQILHKLRAGMVRPDQDRIGSEACDHAEVDETWVGGRTRGKGRGVHHKLLVASAVEVRQRKPGTKLDKRKGGRYAGRVRLAVVPDRSAESLCGFVEGAVTSGASVITDDWSGYTSLAKRGYKHLAVAERGNSQVAEEYLPIIHLVFSNLKTWLSGIHHGVSHQHLQAYLNEFTFRFNRRFYPFNAFRSLLGIAGDVTAPTYAELYSGDWEHPRCSGCG